MNELVIPDLAAMTDDEIREWVSSLTTERVYAHLPILTRRIRERFGEHAAVSTSTYLPPKIIFLAAEMRQ